MHGFFGCCILINLRCSSSAVSSGHYFVRSNEIALAVDSYGDVQAAANVAPLMRTDRIKLEHASDSEASLTLSPWDLHASVLIEKDNQIVSHRLNQSFAPKLLQELDEEKNEEATMAIGENVNVEHRGQDEYGRSNATHPQWSNWFSEEHGGWEQPYRREAVDCWWCGGGHCDNQKFRHMSGKPTTESGQYWTPWFSEEHHNPQKCRDGYVVARGRCKGSKCDDMQLLCQKPDGNKWLTKEDTKGQTGFFSEEQGFRCCPSGQYVYGMQCSGSYCDNHKLFCKGWRNPPQDGKWSSWGRWNLCSKTCGSGSQKRSRSKSSPKHGGREASGASEETQACNKKACPTTITTTTTSTTTVVANATKSLAQLVHSPGNAAGITLGFIMFAQSIMAL